MDRRDFLSGITAACAASRAAAGLPAETEVQSPARHCIPVASEPVCRAVQIQSLSIPLEDVQLLTGPVADQQESNRQYLLKLNADRLLSCFRQAAGLEPKAPPYRGWESEGPSPLYGHMLGFYLSGAAMMVRATKDSELKRRLDYITDELEAVQAANGSGYLLAVPQGKKLFRDIAAGDFAITHAELNYGFEINNVFEPTYTWNKVTLGLYESYQATGNPKTREVLIRAANWLGEEVLDHLTTEQVQALLFCEHGSIHESMLAVFQITGAQKYLRWARILCFERLLQPLAQGNGQFLNGYHANCSIPVFTGFERIYQYTGEIALHEAAVSFLDEVIDNRSWVIGGNSAREHFFPVREFENALHSPAGPETCNSVNVLRLIEAVFATQSDPKLIDHYERILWNHLLAAHEPHRGTVVYYTPLAPGAYRVYSDEFDSTWCCVGTGLESPGKYGQMIYSARPGQNVLDVNLFVGSRLTWNAAGIVLQQDTKFPEAASTTLTVMESPRESFSIRLRHPWWIKKGAMKLRVNGSAVHSVTAPGQYAAVTRRWASGDRIDVDLPMTLSVTMLPYSRQYAAMMYGPIVLSGVLGREGLSKRDFWAIDNPVPPDPLAECKVPSIVVAAREIPAHCEPVDGRPMNFILKGSATSTSDDVLMIPFYMNHYQRYAVYWKIQQASATRGC